MTSPADSPKFSLNVVPSPRSKGYAKGDRDSSKDSHSQPQAEPLKKSHSGNSTTQSQEVNDRQHSRSTASSKGSKGQGRPRPPAL